LSGAVGCAGFFTSSRTPANGLEPGVIFIVAFFGGAVLLSSLAEIAANFFATGLAEEDFCVVLATGACAEQAAGTGFLRCTVRLAATRRVWLCATTLVGLTADGLAGAIAVTGIATGGTVIGAGKMALAVASAGAGDGWEGVADTAAATTGATVAVIVTGG